jgi:hypothetical protein
MKHMRSVVQLLGQCLVDASGDIKYDIAVELREVKRDALFGIELGREGNPR